MLGNPLTRWLAGAAGGLALVTGAWSGGYLLGRVNGWQAHEDADNATALELLQGQLTQFQADFAANQSDGDYAREEISAAGQTIEDVRNEIASLLDRMSCPSDPGVSVSVDAATADAAAAIDRAARRRADDPAERKRSARPAPG